MIVHFIIRTCLTFHAWLGRSFRGFKEKDFLFEKTLTGHLPGIIAEFSKGKPALVFCRYLPLLLGSM